MKKIVKENDFTLKIPVMKSVEGQKVPFPLPACTDVQVRVCNQFKRISLSYEVDVENDNVILARVEGDQIPLGTYAIEVKGKIFGNDWRSNEYPQFSIVAKNADSDTEFGETDDGDNSVEMDTAMVILPPSVELSDLINKANDALKNNKETNDTLNANERARKEAEAQRVTAENERDFAENGRSSAEAERVKAENKRNSDTSSAIGNMNERIVTAISELNTHRTEFEKAESKRVSAENERVEAETTRKQTEADRVSAEGARAEAEQTRVDAETKRERDFDTAIKAAETATTGAETCNVELSGSTISVTNRNGETKSVDVINTDEEVTVTITSSVESISVAGIKINVFLNNGKTPQTYTTDSEGKTTFKVSRGVYYQVAVPEYANAQPLSPIGFTSVGVSKTITFNYEPYDEETSEKVIVTVTKYTDGNGTPWEGKEVIVTIDNKATTYTTDGKGQATIYVPYLKEYTVRVDDEDGYYVRFNKNSRTFTSRVAQRLIQVNMYQFKTGIYVLDNDATEYYIEDWVAAGKSAEEAVAIKVADQNLRLNRGTFIIRCGDLKDMTKLQSYQWCTQGLQFTSIALNGNTSSDPNYWNGEQSSFLVRQEAEERSLSVPAFAFAYGQSLEIGGEKLNGFLMSVGQEYVHISNAGTIREVLRTLFGDSVADAYYKFVNEQSRWTSTQSNAANAWSFTSQAYNNYKNRSYYVLPVFAC